MLENLSRFKMTAIAFALVVAFLAANLVGSEDDKGMIAEWATGDDGTAAPQAMPDHTARRPVEQSVQQQGSTSTEFLSDAELIDGGEGFDPMPEGEAGDESSGETRVIGGPMPGDDGDEGSGGDDAGEIISINGDEGPFN